jgi:murein DD-endopeptidase MepM/ murein hydrolase activator NlpD
MKWATRQRIQTLLVALGILVAVAIVISWLSLRSKSADRRNIISEPASSTPSPVAAKSLSSPTVANPTPDIARPVSPSPNASPGTLGDQSSASSVATPHGLIIPVAGVRAEQLRDTFADARSDGRVHDAIDIPAPKGTPVLAAADGKIIKLFQSIPGGTTIYQLSSDEKFIYYYAHLDHYAEGLNEGRAVKQGETIAYVGDTGNAGAGNYHLHFSIAITSNPKRYWEGVNINPYPLLK